MKRVIYGKQVIYWINPIYPDSALVYHNHDIYDMSNFDTFTKVYYYMKAIDAGIRDGKPLKTIKEDGLYTAKDLEYIMECIPDTAGVIKEYLKH